MDITIGDKALITTDNWFLAPNGQSYKAVFGTIKGVRSAEETLSIKTNEKSTNWYVEIGNMIIAGCQIHYVIKTDDASKDKSLGWQSSAESGVKEYEHPCSIFFADEEYKPSEPKRME